MLPQSPSFEHRALNRVTFGARDTDVVYAQSIGWSAWVAEQLSPPPGDDSALVAHLAAQTMPISYEGKDTDFGGWKAVEESRPLNYLNADIETLWNIRAQAGKTVSFAEVSRVQQELAAATWIRNTHAKYQVREFLTDFWHNHFNIGKEEDPFATVVLPVYDREAIRPHVLGNFREMLEANAASTSMLIYLDNYISNASTPNENYARELMELHTLGAGAYLGESPKANAAPSIFATNTVADGFTDTDVVQVSRAFSGWTVEAGQRADKKTKLPSTGKFLYRPEQHNTAATTVLGVSIAPYTADMAQGRKVLDILAEHSATADFVCTKLCKRIFGDAPPATVVSRAKAAWSANIAAPDQIKKVMEAILLGGDEIGTAPAAKIRRPYERLLALFRTTDMVVNAHRVFTGALDSLHDGLFAWPAPNGRPDVNGYWMSTGATLSTWNLLLKFPYAQYITSTLIDQTPAEAAGSAIGVVEYWVGRMIGYMPDLTVMQGLIADQAGALGVPAALKSKNQNKHENACRRLVGLISTSETFTYR